VADVAGEGGGRRPMVAQRRGPRITEEPPAIFGRGPAVSRGGPLVGPRKYTVTPRQSGSEGVVTQMARIAGVEVTFGVLTPHREDRVPWPSSRTKLSKKSRRLRTATHRPQRPMTVRRLHCHPPRFDSTPGSLGL